MVRRLAFFIAVFFSSTLFAIEFTYDRLGRLAQITSETETRVNFLHDATGNLISLARYSGNDAPLLITIANLAPESSSPVDYSKPVLLSWNVTNPTDVPLYFDLYLSDTSSPILYKSALTSSSITVDLSHYHQKVHWQVIARVPNGQLFTSEVMVLPYLDSDGDGLPNHIEDGLCTDSDNVDSDSDGLLDNEELQHNTAPCNADSDGDGIPDGWEVENGLNPLVDDGLLDADGDGFSNLAEYQAGTDPQDSASQLASTLPFIDFEDETFGAYFWRSQDTPIWQLSTNVSAGQFSARSAPIGRNGRTVLATTFYSLGGEIHFDAAVSSEAQFDKLRFYINDVEQLNISGEQAYQTYSYLVDVGVTTVRWEYSKDGSGNRGQDSAWLDNIQLPGYADSDGDGIADGWEYHYFNGLDVDLTTDSDGDGLSDQIEGELGSDPFNIDSDNDGLPDKWEVKNGLNPLVNDSLLDADGDGFSNLAEYQAGTDPSSK